MHQNSLNFLSEDLFTLFRLFHKTIVNPTPSNKKDPLTRSHYEVMFILEDIGTLPMSEIAKRLYVSKPYMTSLIDRLVDMKLVERTPDKSDRRVKNIVLTEQGIKVLHEHKVAVENNISSRISKLSNEDLQQLLSLSKDMNSIISKLEP